MLKENLRFDLATTEDRDADRKYLVIPVNDRMLDIKKLDKNGSLYLLILIDKTSEIKSGNIVYYRPVDGKKSVKLDRNVFSGIFNNSPLNVSGKFHFLDLTGRLLYQYEYKNGNRYSFGVVKPKSTGQINGNKTDNVCIDWYLETYIEYTDGTRETIREYLGTTCYDCSDFNYMTLCPGVGGGGSGPSQPTPPEDLPIIEDVNEDTPAEEDPANAPAESPDDPNEAPRKFDPVVWNHHATITLDADTREITFVYQDPATVQPLYSYIYWRPGVTDTRRLSQPFQTYKNFFVSSDGKRVTLSWRGTCVGKITRSGSPNYGRTDFFYDNTTIVRP
ncbi:hypothetical protein GWC95_04605 [Sediminibacterium roseum]|uniref:Uncharacterized protein n=1 Tax=Sediminibacterium roseum TaxID=1978412 RepID=A0ABW9ZRW0_9BACT|nr:hypothetical protein [Sediminibacterium roseum]NCI49192.1 hypothetical protein [Sediminibacterium roseum]